MHALIKDNAVAKYPYGLTQLKGDNQNTSFPAQVSDATLVEFDVYRVFFSTPPEITSTQVLEEGVPVFDDEAQRWTQVWQVRDMTVEEIDERTKAQASSIRAERNAKLAETDWTQLADAPVNKEAWATYRQALRDVTTQSGFPWTVTWPDAP